MTAGRSSEDETMGEIRDRWALDIGRLLLAFGEIEYATLECLKLFPRDAIFESVAAMPLARRIALINCILVGRKDLEDQTAEILRLLRRAEELLIVRNTVAHNSFVFEFHQGSSEDDLRMVDALVNAKGNRRFTHHEIAAAALNAHEVALALIESHAALYRYFAPAKP